MIQPRYTTRSGQQVIAPGRYRGYDYNGIEGTLSNIQQNYYAGLCNLGDEETQIFEVATVGAGIGGGFVLTSKLRVMKYKEAISSPDSNEW